MDQRTWPSFVQITASGLFDAKPVPEPMLTYCPGKSFSNQILTSNDMCFRSISSCSAVLLHHKRVRIPWVLRFCHRFITVRRFHDLCDRQEGNGKTKWAAVNVHRAASIGCILTGFIQVRVTWTSHGPVLFHRAVFFHVLNRFEIFWWLRARLQ